MPDQAVLHTVLRRFARTMAHHYDVTEVLDDLVESIRHVLDGAEAGVALLDDRERLSFVTANSHRAVTAEKVQEEHQSGPCRTAIARGRPVAITDLRTADQWPEYRDVVTQLGLHAVLAVPMVLDGRRVGAVDIYDSAVRHWRDDQVAAAEVLADVAAAYVLNASELQRTRQTADQLQVALDSRIAIEQAKGRLAGELGISLDDAFHQIRQHARSTQRKVREVACEVAEAGARALPGAAAQGDRRLTSR